MHLRCPLCGRLVPVIHFYSLSYDDDIKTVRLRGLGRGKGFAPVEETSILTNNLTVIKIRERILSILSALIRNGVVSKEYVAGRLGIVYPQPEPDVIYRTVRDVNLEEAAKEAERKVYEVMDLDLDDVDENEGISVRLKRAVNRLISDYADLRDVAGV
jgi:hypothetical protein